MSNDLLGGFFLFVLIVLWYNGKQTKYNNKCNNKDNVIYLNKRKKI